MDLPAIKIRFGKVVLRRRLTAQTGQEEFAAKAGIHRTTLSLIERGKHMPNLAMVHQLATAFGVTMATLVAETENEETPQDEPPALRRGRPRKQEKAKESPHAKEK